MPHSPSTFFELTFLGTSASVPSVDRNQPGLLISVAGERILVDCGEGIQRQLLRSGAGLRRFNRLLLTHAHFDHLLGIPGLLSTMGLQQNTGILILNGGVQTLQVVDRMLEGLWGRQRAPVKLDFVPIAHGDVIDKGSFRIIAFRVRHRDSDSYGYSFETVPHRHLLPERLVELEVPDGPVRRELTEGRSVTLPNGRVIEPEEVLGAPDVPRKVVVIGDVETTEGLSDFVRGADVLVIEATFLERDKAIARDYGHLTATEAASLAASSGVKLLVLTHISGRYATDEILEEAKTQFAAVHVANDLDYFSI